MTINDKLIEIQSDLKAPKGQYNSFGKYHYRNCEDILEAVKPLLKQQQLTILLSDEIVQVGSRFYIKATAKITDTEGNAISTTAYAREEESKKGMDGSQVTGASSSYARKYALNGLFAIDDNKDSDTTNNGSDSKKSRKNSEPQPEPTQPKEYKCAYCGNPFKGFTAKSDGKVYTAGQAYHISEKKYGGKAYCSTDCANKAGAKPIEPQRRDNNA